MNAGQDPQQRHMRGRWGLCNGPPSVDRRSSVDHVLLEFRLGSEVSTKALWLHLVQESDSGHAVAAVLAAPKGS